MKKRLTKTTLPTILLILPLYSPAASKHYSAIVLSAKNAYTCYSCRTNNLKPIQRRSRIKEGETITTTKNGYASLKFQDGALMKIRQNSKIRIQGFNYFRKTRQGKLNVKILHSTNVLFISGEMRKNNIKFTSHIGTIGIRGTIWTGTFMPNNFTLANARGLIVFKSRSTGKWTLLYSGKTLWIDPKNPSSFKVLNTPKNISSTINGDANILKQESSNFTKSRQQKANSNPKSSSPPSIPRPNSLKKEIKKMDKTSNKLDTFNTDNALSRGSIDKPQPNDPRSAIATAAAKVEEEVTEETNAI